MVQLVTSQGRSLTPQLSLAGTGFRQGQQIGQNMANREALRAQQAKASQLSGFQRAAAGGDKQALQQVAGLDPQAARQIQSLLANQSESERAEGLRENDVLTRTALDALSIEDSSERRLFLERKKNQFREEGRDTSNIDRALTLDDNGLNQAITMQARMGKSVADLASQTFSDPQKPTSLQQNLIAAGLVPGSEEFQSAVLESVTKSATTVNLGSGDNAFAKELAKGQARNVALVREEADAAIDANQSLSILENIDVNTGALEPAKQGLAAFANAFGLDGSRLASVSAGEAFNAEAQRLVLSVKATQKGPQTDKDEATIRKTVANLGNSKLGNQFVIDSARAMNNRKIGRKDFYDSFLEESGGKFRDEEGVTADAAWSRFKRNTPMISSKLRTTEGLPVFFFKFDDAVRAANPDATRAEILEAWRAADKRAK